MKSGNMQYVKDKYSRKPVRMQNRIGQRARSPGPGDSFTCENCRRVVQGTAPGTKHRNHCPWCLWSLHVDLASGDRRCGCRGPMEPIAVWARPNREWAIVHMCRECGWLRVNRIAGDDNELILITLAVRPLASVPFPVHDIEVTKTGSAE